jgi:hypothetical protein
VLQRIEKQGFKLASCSIGALVAIVPDVRRSSSYGWQMHTRNQPEDSSPNNIL